MKPIPASFYDSDYYERGRSTGKGWYENYRWMPMRSFREAFGFIDALGLGVNDCVLDFGCAKGFLVRALRELGINANGCDISNYALQLAPRGCWNCADKNAVDKKAGKYTHIICKDVFEHLTESQLIDTLKILGTLAPIIMCVVPLGDNGVYRIPLYHYEATHLIAENEAWWQRSFDCGGWEVRMRAYRIQGIKDNWIHYPNGNGFYLLRTKNG